ncbi:MAG: NAD(P)-dependent oxidoreductase [Pseudomonadota bacterium]
MGRVLVTGATGFLGGAVLRRLGARGVGQGRNPAMLDALKTGGLSVVRWDLPGPAPTAPELAEITAVVHCAGLSAPFGSSKAFHRANVLGTRAVIDFAKARGVERFVFVSSPSVYFALQDQLDMREDADLPRPFTAYAESKIAAEALVRARPELGPVILRPRGLYGPGDTALLPRLLKTAGARPLPRFRDGRARIDLTYIDDVVQAVLAALAADDVAAGQTVNISGGEVIPVHDIVERACALAGVIPRWRDMPLRPALWAARLAETAAFWSPGQQEPLVTRYALGLFAFEQSLNIDRAREVLNWTPNVGFAEGLSRTFGPEGPA